MRAPLLALRRPRVAVAHAVLVLQDGLLRVVTSHAAQQPVPQAALAVLGPAGLPRAMVGPRGVLARLVTVGVHVLREETPCHCGPLEAPLRPALAPDTCLPPACLSCRPHPLLQSTSTRPAPPRPAPPHPPPNIDLRPVYSRP